MMEVGELTLRIPVLPQPTGTSGPFGPTRASCGEGDGTPLQDSCLENPMDGGAW